MDGDQKKKIICLFDVDGTLTRSRIPVSEDVDAVLTKLRKKVDIGLVSGSDFGKIKEQMCTDNSFFDRYKYIFAENGVVAYINGKQQNTGTIINYLGEEKLQTLINFCLEYMSKLVLPCKRGNFIELRHGMINVCPVGRSCSQEERDNFAAYDATHDVRKMLASALTEKFADEYGLTISIGGQISVDVFPRGWDKTYCLRHLEDFDEIYFFGDRTWKGGNDHEIYSHEKTIGHAVESPEHTKKLLTELFNLD